MKLKTGDNVVVITGKDKGKEGKIIAVDRKNNRVMVEGVNMVSKHMKPTPMNQQGGIIKKEGFIDAVYMDIFFCNILQINRINFCRIINVELHSRWCCYIFNLFWNFKYSASPWYS
jgi:ribosomal protein L24